MPADEVTAPGGAATLRIDKWLWHVRVVKSRTSAAALVTEGRVRLNRERVTKPSHGVRAGDVVTVAVGPRIRVLEVVSLGERRGPPSEAQQLYRDLTPPPRAETAKAPIGPERTPGSGRPTKRDRRLIDRLTDQDD